MMRVCHTQEGVSYSEEGVMGLRRDSEGAKVIGDPMHAEEGVGRRRKASEGIGRLRKASEGIGRRRKASEGIGRRRKASEGIGRRRKASEGIGRHRTLRSWRSIGDSTLLPGERCELREDDCGREGIGLGRSPRGSEGTPKQPPAISGQSQSNLACDGRDELSDEGTIRGNLGAISKQSRLRRPRRIERRGDGRRRWLTRGRSKGGWEGGAERVLHLLRLRAVLGVVLGAVLGAVVEESVGVGERRRWRREGFVSVADGGRAGGGGAATR